MLRSLVRIGYALLAMSTIGVHAYTVVVAYHLASPGAGKYLAAGAALWFFPVSEAVVAYYAWLESGSRVNTYSVWILLWLLLALLVVLLAKLDRRLKKSMNREQLGD